MAILARQRTTWIVVAIIILSALLSVRYGYTQSDDLSRPAEFYLNYLTKDESATADDRFQPQNLDLYVTVVNKAGQAIAAPDINRATLRLNAQEFPVVIEIPDDIPLFITLVLDTSGSMRSAAEEMRASVTQLLDVLPEGANISILTFNSRQSRYPTSPASGFTRDRAALRNAVPQLLANSVFDPDGGTCLYDATIQAIQDLQPQGDISARRAVVVFTDGEDRVRRNEATPCSENTESDVIAAANNANARTPIYTVGFLGLSGANPDVLNNLAASTGGLAALANTTAERVTTTEFNNLFNQIVNALFGQRRARANVCVPSGRYTVELLAEVNGEDVQTAFGNLTVTENCVIPVPLNITVGTFRYENDVLLYNINRTGDIQPFRYRVSVRDETGAEIPGSPFPDIIPNPDRTQPTQQILDRNTLPLGRLTFTAEALDADGNVIATAENEFTVVAPPTFTPTPTRTLPPTLTPTDVVSVEISRFRIEGSEFVFDIIWRGGSNLQRYEIQITDENNVIVWRDPEGRTSFDVLAREMRFPLLFSDLMRCTTIRVIVDAFDDLNNFVVRGTSENTLVPCTATPTHTQTASPTPTPSFTPTATPTATDTPLPTPTATPPIALLIEGFRIDGDQFVFDIELSSGLNVAGYRVRLTDPGGLQLPGIHGDFTIDAEADGSTTVSLPINELQCSVVVVRVRPRDAENTFLLREEVTSREAPILCTPTPAPLTVHVRELRYSADRTMLEFDAEVSGVGQVQQFLVVINDASGVRIAGERGEIPVSPNPDNDITTIQIPVSELPPGDLNICVRVIADRRVADDDCAPFNLAHTATPTFTPSATATATPSSTPTATPTTPIGVIIEPIRLIDAATLTYEFVIVRTGDDIPASYRITILSGGQPISGQAGRFIVPSNATSPRTVVRFSLADSELGENPNLQILVAPLDAADDPLAGVPLPLSTASFNPNVPTSTPPPTPTPTPEARLRIPEQGAISYVDGTFTIDANIDNPQRIVETIIRVVHNVPNQPPQPMGRITRSGSPSQPITFTENELMLGRELPASGSYTVIIEMEVDDGTRLPEIAREVSVTKPVVVQPSPVERLINDARAFIVANPLETLLIVLLVLLVLALVILIVRRLTRTPTAPDYNPVAPPLVPSIAGDSDATFAGILPVAGGADEVRARIVLVEPFAANSEWEIGSSMGQITLGRGDPKPGEYKIPLPDQQLNAQISRSHAYLRFEGGRFVLIANQDNNPTYLDGSVLTAGLETSLERFARPYFIELGNFRQIKLTFEYLDISPEGAAAPGVAGSAYTPLDPYMGASAGAEQPPPAAGTPHASYPTPSAGSGSAVPVSDISTLPAHIQARLVVKVPANHTPSEYDINKNVILMGRDAECDIRFDAAVVTQDVSRKHARLEWSDDEGIFKLTHLSGKNPTLLNDIEITGANTWRPLEANVTHRICFANNPVRVELEFTYRSTYPTDEATTIQPTANSESTTIQSRADLMQAGATNVPAVPPAPADVSDPELTPPTPEPFVPPVGSSYEPAPPVPPSVKTTMVPPVRKPDDEPKASGSGEVKKAVTPETPVSPPAGAPAFVPPPTDFSVTRSLPEGITAELRVVSMPGGEDGKLIPFNSMEVKIGRAPLNDYIIPEQAIFVSKNHCAVVWDTSLECFVFQDRESRAGTSVITRRPQGDESVLLYHDEIRLEPNVDYIFYLSPEKEIDKGLPPAKFSFRYTVVGGGQPYDPNATNILGRN